MDWFSWLSNTTLDPSLVYEYALAFSQNELEEEDIVHFNHEFLQSMGIYIAKHRLEILKHARKQKRGLTPKPVSKLLLAIKRTKRNLAKYIGTLVCRPDPSSALVVVNPRSRSGYANKWKGSMLKRNKKMNTMGSYQRRLLLTNGTPLLVSGSARVASFSSPMVFDGEDDDQDDDDDEDDGYWSSAAAATAAVVDEIRWDTMFQDLKPN